MGRNGYDVEDGQELADPEWQQLMVMVRIWLDWKRACYLAEAKQMTRGSVVKSTCPRRRSHLFMYWMHNSMYYKGIGVDMS
jgi:hypothetical protein